MDRDIHTPVVNLQKAIEEFVKETSFEIYTDQEIVKEKCGELLENVKKDQSNENLKKELELETTLNKLNDYRMMKSIKRHLKNIVFLIEDTNYRKSKQHIEDIKKYEKMEKKLTEEGWFQC